MEHFTLQFSAEMADGRTWSDALTISDEQEIIELLTHNGSDDPVRDDIVVGILCNEAGIDESEILDVVYILSREIKNAA